MAEKQARSRSKGAKKRAGSVPRAASRLVRRPAAKQGIDARVAERIIAGLAHDIRTPLTGLIVASELLGASKLDDRQRRWVEVLKGNADHLAALTTLVVDASRHSASEFVLQNRLFAPRQVADAAAASLAARAEAAGLTCAIDIAVDLPPQAYGDTVRLRAALENLIDNAVKFTQEGKVGLTVTAEPGARGLRMLFAVSDSGIGLTTAEARRLFRPFTQAHEGIAKRFGGTGLGLSLVKRLAKAMGGDLKVRSAPGRGSTFLLSVVVPSSARDGSKRVGQSGK
jgi:signal transduction histidine kinase